MNIVDKLNQQVARGQASDRAVMQVTGQTVAEFDADTTASERRFSPDGYLIQLHPRPTLGNLEGRFAQNGIRVPSTGRWILLPGSSIWQDHAREIRRLNVLPTLYFGVRRDRPIIQVR